VKTVLALALVALVAACGADDRSSPSGSVPAQSGAEEALSIEEVLAASFTGEPILVEGSLYVEGGVTRLCSGFRESYPPQCMEPSLVLEGFALASVNGLQQASGVRWSDTPFRVRGEMRD
jgi:hypothetical protein